MARFYERYGLIILWSLTSALGIILVYWSIVALATHTQVIPATANMFILVVHEVVASSVAALVRLVEANLQRLGAIATLGTFMFGVVTGVRQAKRALPGRLMRFMTEQLAPVYNSTETVVAAVGYRSSNVPVGEHLFRRHPLNVALNTLGDAYRPKKRRSLTEAINEAGKHIEVTEKRLAYLRDIKAHATLLRGAVQSADADASKANGTGVTANVEADFTTALENDTTRQAALELRGLLRSRRGNFRGALRDFEALVDNANVGTVQYARAVRHRADALRLQAGGINSLRDARGFLNGPYGGLQDGRTHSDEECLELGYNRESYGEVQAAIAAHAGSDNGKALKALNDALAYFARLGKAGDEHYERVRRRIQALTAPKSSP